MMSTIEYPPVAKSGFSSGARPDGGANADASYRETARKPAGDAQTMPVPCVAATPVTALSASGTAQTGQPAIPVEARRARLLRDLSLVSPAGVLVFLVGLALISICTAIF